MTDVHFEKDLTQHNSRDGRVLCLHRLVKFALSGTSAATSEDFCRALLNDRMRESSVQLAPHYASLHECTRLVTELRKTGLKASTMESMGGLALKMLTLYYRRAMLKIGGSRLGLGPETAARGDLVVVFLGCNVPMVLRKLPDAKFRVIGKATCHGVMAGEAILGNLPEGVEFTRHVQDRMSYAAFRDTRSGAIGLDDPRLPPGVPAGRAEVDDQRHLAQTDSIAKGKKLLMPRQRWDIDELEKQGVKVRLQDFVLV